MTTLLSTTRKAADATTIGSVTIDAAANKDENTMNIGLVSYCVGEQFVGLQQLVTHNHHAYAAASTTDATSTRIAATTSTTTNNNHHNHYNQNVYIFQGNETNFPIQSFITPGAWLKAAYIHHLLSTSTPPTSSSSSLSHKITTTITSQDMDWFLWLDCDALISRFDVTIPKLLEEELNVQSHHNLIVAPDKSPTISIKKNKNQNATATSDSKELSSPMNTGVMLIRNCIWSLQLVFQMYWLKLLTQI